MHLPRSLAGLVGAATGSTPLVHKTELGPCRATVTCTAVELASGRKRFSVSESWSIEGGGQLQWVDLFDDAGEATKAAAERAHAWARGSARSDELAPGGRLRTEPAATRERPRIVLPGDS